MPRRKRQTVYRNKRYNMPFNEGQSYQLELSGIGANRIVIYDFLGVIKGILEMDDTNLSFCRFLDREFGIFIKIGE